VSVSIQNLANSSLAGDLRKKVREVVRFRELLLNLTRKELKVRYKNSALGFVWSMVNPLLYLVVFYIVFNVFLPAGIPKFHVYLLSGLIPWTLFSNGLFQSTGSVVGNTDLVKKVYFPREFLPLSSIGAAVFHFFLQLGVLAAFLAITRFPLSGMPLLLIIPALVAELLVVSGMGLLLSAINVKARDTQHFLELALLAWFWLTPIVYPSAMAADRMTGRTIAGIPMLGLYLANPMARIVLAFQRAIYGQVTPVIDGQPFRALIDAPLHWYLQGIGFAALAGVVLIAFGWWVFHRLDPIFAEEL
jgi:ABC-2 type transport system permease protein